MADTQVAPAPAPATITIPAPTITAGWATPGGQPADESKPARERAPKRRGIPAGPALASAGNATAMGLTAAAEAGGLPALAAAGGVVALGTVAAVVRRRRTVKRRTSIGANHRGGFTGAGSRTGSWGGSRGSGWGGSGSGSAGSPQRGSAGSVGSAASGSRGGSRTGSGSGSQRNGTGTAPTERLGRISDRKAGGKGKKQKQRQQPGMVERAVKTVGRGTSRAASAAWRASKKPRATLKAAAKRHAQKARGAASDALKAFRSGVWGVLRHVSFKKGAAKGWAAWKQHRANRKNKQQTPDTTMPQRTIASVARKPANSTSSSTNGGITMPGHHFTGPAMEMARAAAAYEPQGMLQVGQDFVGLKEAMELVAEAMKITVENADAKFPLHPQIVEIMRNMHGLALKGAEMANELQPAFRNLHQVDLARLETPRKGLAGERMWDVSTNLQ